jgi:ADP-ribose diphosphatase
MQSENWVFLTGALCRPDILRLVVDTAGSTAASLQGFGANKSVPGIWPMPHSSVEGQLVQLATAQDHDRLNFYCAVYGAKPTQMMVTQADGQETAAQAYVTAQGDLRFILKDDAFSHAVHIRMAVEIMMYFNMHSAAYIADRLAGVFRRATSFVASQSLPADPDRDLSTDVVIKNRQRPYVNFFAAEELDLQFRRYDGNFSDVVNRGTLHVGQVVAVLPYDPVRDCVLIVEQFRAALMMSGNRAPWVWQPVAGLIDPGEAPETAAHREAAEEADVTLSRLENAGHAYSSPGSSTEFVFLYVGIADLPDSHKVGGLAAEDEDILARVLSFEDLMKAVDSNQFQDLPLLMLANWLARHRDRLRLMA